MMELKRLFDCLQYNLDRKPLEDMLAGKEGGQWKKYSTADVKNIVDNLSAGLLSMGTFVLLYTMAPEAMPKLAKVAFIDAVAMVLLVVGYWCGRERRGFVVTNS